jgi:hypothetical protein
MEQKKVSFPIGFGFTQSAISLPGVAHEGILYFMGRTSILMYDPSTIMKNVTSLIFL